MLSKGTIMRVEPESLIVREDEICDDCRSVGELCGYHRGFADGWDAAAAVMERQRI